jgi:Na+/H+-dicarboxylate symporter
MSQLSNVDFISIIVASISLVITTTWNTLVHDIIQVYFPQSSKKTITAQILYAIIISFSFGILLYYLKNHRKELLLRFNNFVSDIKHFKFKIKIPDQKIPIIPEIPEIF